MEIKSAVRSHCKTLQKCLACGNTRVCQIKSLVASMTVVCGGLNTQRGHRTVHERIQSSGTMRGRLMLIKNIGFKFYRSPPIFGKPRQLVITVYAHVFTIIMCTTYTFWFYALTVDDIQIQRIQPHSLYSAHAQKCL